MNSARQKWADDRRAQRRLKRLEIYQRGLRPMALAAWNISKEHNVGSLVRTAHATGVENVFLAGTRQWNIEAAKTSQFYTSIEMLDGVDAFRQRLREENYALVAVELAPNATNLFEAEYPERPCFLLGAELEGVPEILLKEAALVVQIPQWGLVPSLNLAVAGSIVLYDYLGKLHRDNKLDRPDGGMFEDEE